jgi:hypothetical protein
MQRLSPVIGAAISTAFTIHLLVDWAAVPTDQCVGFDHRQSASPVEETGQLSERKANGVRSALRLDLSFNVEPELFVEEEILDGDSSS